MQEIKQALFNKAVKGLARQGFAPSYLPDGEGTCAYRGEDGKRCALGHLIPDAVYKPEMEGHNALDLLAPGGSWGTGLRVTDLEGMAGYDIDEDQEQQLAEFLFGLQGCHDSAASPGVMRVELQDFADLHGLALPPTLREKG